MKKLLALLLVSVSALVLQACGSKDKNNSAAVNDYYRYDRAYNGRYTSANLRDVGTGYNAYSDSDLTLAIYNDGTLYGDMFIGYDNLACPVPYGRYDIRTLQPGGFYNPSARTLQNATVEAIGHGGRVVLYIQYATFYSTYSSERAAAQVQIASVNGYPCNLTMFFGENW